MASTQRTSLFWPEGNKGQEQAYIEWPLARCTKSKSTDILTEGAIERLATGLSMPLQIEQYLTLAFEAAYQVGQKPVTIEIVSIGRRRMLRSNRVPVRIKDLTEMLQADEAAFSVFRGISGIVLGYSRLWHGRSDFEDRVVKLAQAFPDRAWSPLLRYIIVRATAEKMKSIEGPVRLPAKIHSLAKLAADDRALGEHRTAKVWRILDAFPQTFQPQVT